MEPKEIGLVADALAVPALTGLASGEKRSEKPLVRLAAVAALGGIEGEASVSGLISALRDLEPSITQEAAAHLVKKGRAPLQASLLGPREPVVAGLFHERGQGSCLGGVQLSVRHVVENDTVEPCERAGGAREGRGPDAGNLISATLEGRIGSVCVADVEKPRSA